MERTTWVVLVVDHEMPIVVGPEQFTVVGTLNELMDAALLSLPPEVTSRTISTMMITAATTPATMSQFRRRLRACSSSYPPGPPRVGARPPGGIIWVQSPPPG